MAALPSSISGSTYLEAWQRLLDAASEANGLDPIDGDPPEPLTSGFVPRLSNGQAAAVMQGWRRAAQRSRVAWGLWYELTIYALGWRKDGDRFNMSPAHVKAPFPTEMLPLVWSWTARLAEELDNMSTKVGPIYLDNSRAGYEQTARLAWERMQAERRGPGGIPLPDKPPTLPVGPPVTGPALPSVGFPWWLLLIGAYVVTRKGRR